MKIIKSIVLSGIAILLLSIGIILRDDEIDYYRNK